MNHKELETILEFACKVAGCSISQALGTRRKGYLMTARYLFFRVAVDHGARNYEAIWFVRRGTQMGRYYNAKSNKLAISNPVFQEQINKIQYLYEKSV